MIPTANTNTSSIDDILATAHLPPEQRMQSPKAPEQKFLDDPADNESDFKEAAIDRPIVQEEKIERVLVEKPQKNESSSQNLQNNIDFDDYGNEKPPVVSKTYTEEEVNERINKTVRERLERLERNNPQQIAQQIKPQKSDDFNFDTTNPEDVQAQLKNFIKQTNEETQREQMQRAAELREQQNRQEFEEKFHNGMSKFNDFREIVGAQPITDAMTIATRAMKDPAAFLYAASKRHAPELERISKIPDVYSQMVEMGRLEERMKKTQTGTKAPRPIRATREDATIEEPVYHTPTIEEMMMASDRNKLSRIKRRH